MARIAGLKGKRRWRFLVAPLLLPMILGLMLIGLAQAAPDDNGLFELDANVIDQAAAGDDWSNIFAGTDSAFTDNPVTPTALNAMNRLSTNDNSLTRCIDTGRDNRNVPNSPAPANDAASERDG